VRAALLKSVDERHQSWLLESIEAFFAAHHKSVSEAAFVHHLVETVTALGAHGNCIIVGRGSAFILPPETTLRVRLVAPMNSRIATITRPLSLAEKESPQRFRTIERDAINFFRDYTRKDPTDPSLYDLVLNVSRLSVATQATLIIDALRHLEESGGKAPA